MFCTISDFMIRFLLSIITSLLSFLLFSGSVYSHSSVQRIISGADGLDAIVNDFTMDEHGFIWFATDHGLFRATNTDLTRIDLSRGDLRLQDEFFERLHSVGDNKILFDAFQGMYFFDALTNEFSAAADLPAFRTLKPGSFASLRSLTTERKVLLTVNGQLIYFTDINAPALNTSLLPGLEDEIYRDILPLSRARSLVATNKRLGVLNDRGAFQWLKSSLDFKNIHQLIQLGDRIWLASDSGFFEIHLSPERQEIRSKPLLEHATFSAAVNSKHEVWLTSEAGVYSFKTTTDELSRESRSLIRSKNFSVARKLLVDENDLVWVAGYQNQVAIMAPQAEFLKDVFSVDAPYFLKQQDIWSVYGEARYLYAADSNQLMVIDREIKSSVLVNIKGLNPSESIYEIKPLDKRRLLLATTNGLFVFNKETLFSQTFAQWSGGAESLDNKTIYQSYFDPAAQIWWFATSAGLYQWLAGTPDIKPVELGKYTSKVFRSVFVDKSGVLWTGGEYVFGFYKNGAFTAINPVKFNKEILPAVSHISQIDEHRLWLGSTFLGMYQYEIKTGKVTALDSMIGQDCSTTYFFAETGDYKYIGCRNGVLLQYNTANSAFNAFDINDGLIAKEFNEGAMFYQPGAGLFVGTPKGVMLLEDNKLSKRVRHDGVFVSGIDAYYSSHSNVRLLPDKSGTIFEPGAGLISFHIAGHDYLDTELRGVKYRLVSNQIPLQRAFIHIPGNAQINLSNLAPGNYTLQLVNEKTGQGINKPYEFHFTISQHWWHSEQFKSLLAFAVFTIGMLIILRHQNRTEKFRRLNAELQETQDRLQQALKSSDSDLWEWDCARAQLYVGNYSKIFNKSSERKIYDLEQLKIHPDDQAYVMTKWNEMLAGNTDNFDAEYRQMDVDGNWRWIRAKGRPVRFSSDLSKVRTVAGIYTDVTCARNLEEQADLLAEAFANTSEGVLIFDENEVAIAANPAAKTLLDTTSGDNIQALSFSNIILTANCAIGKLLGNDNHWAGELRFRDLTGKKIPVWITLSHIKSKPYTASKYVAVFSDISQRKSAEEKLRRLANFDPLTGLANRTLFSEKLLNTVQQARRQNRRLALMFMDLDRFKNINDSYGHNTGDALLIEAASRIRESVADNAVLSRFGGDEFVLLIPDIADIQEVDEVAKRIHRSIEAPFRLFEREFYISTSIGVSLWPDHATKPDALIKNADLAMYHAKEDGPGNVRYFSSARNEKNLYCLRIESELRKAIEKNQLELHYQPQINILEGDRLIGMEALLRWKHPEDGFIRPDVFIEVAESAGLIIDIDRWVFKTACEQLSQWHKQYRGDFKVSVNVSAAHFLQPDYVDAIKEVMIETGVEGKHIGLEITEGVLMREVEQAQKHLSQLQLLGITVAIDDFGTGYSSLAYLRNFPVNTLKIDRKFIIDINHNGADQAIVASIIELARNLRLDVVAEGIETYDQMEHLIGRGCYLMQGYYFSRPLPSEDMRHYLEQTLNSDTELA